MITNLSLNDILNVYFRGSAQSTNWYLGLISAANFTGFAPTDTMASHPGWTELTTYNEANRPGWGENAASGGQLVNSALIVFTINSPSQVYGIFLCSDNTKGGTVGNLLGPVKLDSVQTLPVGEKLKIQLIVPALSG